MINPMKGLESVAWKSGKEKVSGGVHNSILQHSAMSYGSATAWGAGLGAAYGGIDGALSYDGSFLGGAIHGGMVGAAGGAGARFASSLYATGSKGVVGTKGSFAWKNFSNGWEATP